MHIKTLFKQVETANAVSKRFGMRPQFGISISDKWTDKWELSGRFTLKTYNGTDHFTTYKGFLGILMEIYSRRTFLMILEAVLEEDNPTLFSLEFVDLCGERHRLEFTLDKIN